MNEIEKLARVLAEMSGEVYDSIRHKGIAADLHALGYRRVGPIRTDPELVALREYMNDLSTQLADIKAEIASVNGKLASVEKKLKEKGV